MNNGVEFLRFVAVIFVLSHHAVGSMIAYGVKVGYYESITAFMYSGVDLFFVISGYVIGISYLNKQKIDEYKFLLNRLIRILPSYYLLMTVLLLIQLINPFGLINSDLNIEKYFLSLGFLSWLSWYRSPFIYVGWSLEYEIAFYLAVLLAVLIVDNYFKRALILFVSVVIMSLFCGLDTIFLEFTSGLIVSLMVSKIEKQSMINFIGFLLLFTGILFFVFMEQPDRGVLFSFAYGGLVMLFAATKLRINHVVLLLASATYSIYLIQVFTIPFILKLTVYIGSINASFILMIIVVTTLFLGYCWHRWVDFPLRLSLKKRLIL